jgi:hypothetical protein
MGRWNYWAIFPLTMEQARASLGIFDDESAEPLVPTHDGA